MSEMKKLLIVFIILLTACGIASAQTGTPKPSPTPFASFA